MSCLSWRPVVNVDLGARRRVGKGNRTECWITGVIAGRALRRPSEVGTGPGSALVSEETLLIFCHREGVLGTDDPLTVVFVCLDVTGHTSTTLTDREVTRHTCGTRGYVPSGQVRRSAGSR